MADEPTRDPTRDAVTVPFIDPYVEHVRLSTVLKLNVKQLRALTKTLVIDENGPVAVLIPYVTFMAMQKLMELPDKLLAKAATGTRH